MATLMVNLQAGENEVFSRKMEKLEKNVYENFKGKLRFRLLVEDVEACCRHLQAGESKTLDIGGGAGRFSRYCLRAGYNVVYCDVQPEMAAKAREMLYRCSNVDKVSIMVADFLSSHTSFANQFDLVALHGAAEWMTDPAMAIRKACSLVKTGGCLSLLMFNRDRMILKRGINGQLLGAEQSPAGNTLTPPNAMSPVEVESVLSECSGIILRKSGIRVFYKFFRQVDESLLDPEQWLEQERHYYTKEPYCCLGEHTHFIWERL